MLELIKNGCCCIFLTIGSLTSCSSDTLEVTNRTNANSVTRDSVTEEKLFYLDLKNPTIVQPFDPKDHPFEAARFVKVEVVAVVNPKKHPISFQVHYQTRSGEKLYLGSFGLYPADNPGTFIVPTQRRLKNEGAIVLSLLIPEKVAASDTIKVGVRKIRVIKSE